MSFLSACRLEPVERTPVWFMRQAGRSLPEYRAARKGSLLDAVGDPALACEITLQPVRRYAVDAAVLFSDIVVPLVAVGLPIRIEHGRGPVLDEPFSRDDDLRRLRPIEPASDLAALLETIRLLKKELRVPLIGFAGAPFTLASYLIEGGPSRTYSKTKALMRTEPATWKKLLEALAEMAVKTLRAEIEAGADAVQLFDSWAGALSPREYSRYVLPASRAVMEGLSDLAAPRIHFGVGTGELLELMASAGGEVLGVDWRVPLDEAARRAGRRMALQGNLDPAVCLAPAPVVLEEARQVLFDAKELAGHVFNLGHGVLPETDPGVLAAVADLVHEETAR